MKERYEYMRGRKPEEHPLYGKPVSKERTIKRLATMRKRYTPEEISLMVSKGMKGHKSSKKGLTFEMMYGKDRASKILQKMRLASLGRKHSEESRRKQSLALKGQKRSEEFKQKAKLNRAKQIIPVIDTKIEVKIQNFLKELGIEFFTHQYMKEIEHGYQCDILIPSMNMVIECDGNYWHKYPIGLEKDHIRTKELIEKGFKVLRLWGDEITQMNIEEFKGRLKI